MKYLKFLTLLFIVTAISGCAGKQPLPNAIENNKLKRATPRKGMLYVYRPSSFLGAGIFYDIHDSAQNNKVLGTITSGSIVSAELNPGYHEIWAKTEAKAGVPVRIKRNSVECIKAGVGFGIIVGRPTLQKVDKDTCLYDIRNIINESK